MGSMVNLDAMVLWAPPAATDSERASQTTQQRKFTFHQEPSSQPSSITASHISDEPIYISSDDESTFETDKPATCSGSEAMDDSKSDDTLPSINTILTSVKKGSPDLCPVGSLFNDANQPLTLDTDASRSGQEAATDPDALLPSTPTTAQASSAMQSHISGSPDCMELVASGDAVTTSPLPEMLEISYPPPTLSSGSEAQCESSENYEASNATATSLHHAIEQTRDETQRCGRLLGSCTEDCSVSRSAFHASSNSDNPMRQREEDSLISSNSLSVHEEEKEHHDSVIDDDFGQPLAPQCFISDLRQEGDISMPTAPLDHNSVSEARDTSSRKKRLYNYYLTHSRPDYNRGSNVGSNTVSEPQGLVPSDNSEIDTTSDAVATRQLRRKGKRKNYSSPEQDVASYCDSDSDTSSSSRSEAAGQDDEDYGSSTSRGGRDDEADSSDLPPTRKRRKAGGYQPSPRPHRRSTRLTDHPHAANLSGLHTPVYSASSVSSHGSLTAADAEVPAAKYEEWPVQGATLKRLAMNGKITFQLEFSWKPCAGGHLPGSYNGNKIQTHEVKKLNRTQRSPASHAFTREEDDLIVKLKEEEQLPWPEIHKNFSDEFPQRRSQGSLQVRYCTKLKKSGKGTPRNSRQSQTTR